MMNVDTSVPPGQPPSQAPPPQICIHSLGSVLGVPPCLAQSTFPTEEDAQCTICRMPLAVTADKEDSDAMVCLEPCKHRFHTVCFQQTMQMQMHLKYSQYGGSSARRPHCPLCRTPTTTKVKRCNPATHGYHRVALGPSTSPVLTSLMQVAQEFADAWKESSTASLPIKAEELVPLTSDDARWSTFVPGHTPLYMPSHKLHGLLVYTTKTMACIRVYPGNTQRRFGKHKVAAVVESWGGGATVPVASTSGGA